MMDKKIAFIGAGAVGTHLSLAFCKAGFSIVQVINRGVEDGQLLARTVNASYSEFPEELFEKVTHVFLTLPDQVIPETLSRLPRNDFVVLHTTGSFPMSALKKHGHSCGVFYPLQSFTKDRSPNWNDIPIFIEGSSIEIEHDLMELAEEIGSVGIRLESEKRIKLHMAAIFASNFTNYIQGRAQEMLQGIGLSDDLIRPLVDETISKSYEFGAMKAQTGPARRGDLETLKKHLELLSCCPVDQELYKALSMSIVEVYKK